MNCNGCGLPMDGSGAMHFDCAAEKVMAWAEKHRACTHPKSCLFVKAKGKKKEHA